MLAGTGRARNDGTRAARVGLCVGIYDTTWNFVRSCAPVTIAPGAQVSAVSSYAIPASTQVQSTALYFVPADGSAAIQIAVAPTAEREA